MDQDMKGWFTELSPMWPGQALSLKVEKKLLQKKSNFQDIQIFDSTNHGRVLVLDNAIQCTEVDEFSYQEMITFLPINSHPDPKKVLVIGGGDGGVLRELGKHPNVEEIYHCEIDKEVIQACKTYLPSMACGFDNPKVKFFSGDGSDFLENTTEKYDVIITDASDPVVSPEQNVIQDGPAASLFNDEYYGKMKKKLTTNGILCCQGESMWLHRELITRVIKKCRQEYPTVEYAYTCTPTYPSGQIGFILCGMSETTDFRNPVTVWSDAETEKLNLKYYTNEIHKAAFVLPAFMKREIEATK